MQQRQRSLAKAACMPLLLCNCPYHSMPDLVGSVRSKGMPFNAGGSKMRFRAASRATGLHNEHVQWVSDLITFCLGFQHHLHDTYPGGEGTISPT